MLGSGYGRVSWGVGSWLRRVRCGGMDGGWVGLVDVDGCGGGNGSGGCSGRAVSWETPRRGSMGVGDWVSGMNEWGNGGVGECDGGGSGSGCCGVVEGVVACDDNGMDGDV